jgi:hypothetical protein
MPQLRAPPGLDLAPQRDFRVSRRRRTNPDERRFTAGGPVIAPAILDRLLHPAKSLSSR